MIEKKLKADEADFTPEKIDDKSTANDEIYALGLAIYEMMTEKTAANADFTLSESQVEELRGRLRAVNPTVSEESAEAVIRQLLKKIAGKSLAASDSKKSVIRMKPLAAADSPVFEDAEKKVFANLSFDFSPDGKAIFEKGVEPDSIKTVAGRRRGGISVLWKPGQRRYLIAAAAILATIVLHLVFQVSFIENENLRFVEGVNETALPVRQPIQPPPAIVPDTDVKDSVKIETNKNREEKNAVVAAPKSKTAPLSGREAEVAPARTVFKKKESRETRAERLRRVERFLTGV